MNLVADEGVDRQMVDRLRHHGHQGFYVAEMQPRIPGEVVLALANAEGALLVTADKDFGEVVFRERRSTSSEELSSAQALGQCTSAASARATTPSRPHALRLARRGSARSSSPTPGTALYYTKDGGQGWQQLH